MIVYNAATELLLWYNMMYEARGGVAPYILPSHPRIRDTILPSDISNGNLGSHFIS
jgi:hypothetical protein